MVVTRVDRPRQTGHRFPHFLPDGRHFLFYSLGSPEGRGVYLGTLGSTDATRLFDADSAAVFAAPDRVLFARQGALWAQRLDMSAPAAGRRAGAGLHAGGVECASCLATSRFRRRRPG